MDRYRITITREADATDEVLFEVAGPASLVRSIAGGVIDGVLREEDSDGPATPTVPADPPPAARRRRTKAEIAADNAAEPEPMPSPEPVATTEAAPYNPFAQ